jgi:hypothetical protein
VWCLWMRHSVGREVEGGWRMGRPVDRILHSEVTIWKEEQAQSSKGLAVEGTTHHKEREGAIAHRQLSAMGEAGTN